MAAAETPIRDTSLLKDTDSRNETTVRFMTFVDPFWRPCSGPCQTFRSVKTEVRLENTVTGIHSVRIRAKTLVHQTEVLFSRFFFDFWCEVTERFPIWCYTKQ